MRNHENSFYYTFLGIFFVFVFLLWCYRLASRLSVQNARKREKDFVEYSKKFISTFPSPLPSSFSSPSPSSSFFSKTFEPIVLRGKKFRNRILKAATYEAGKCIYCVGVVIYQLYLFSFNSPSLSFPSFSSLLFLLFFFSFPRM